MCETAFDPLLKTSLQQMQAHAKDRIHVTTIIRIAFLNGNFASEIKSPLSQ